MVKTSVPYMLGVIVGLTMGNFFWQFVHSQLWDVAAERSFFESAGVIIYHLVLIGEQSFIRWRYPDAN